MVDDTQEIRYAQLAAVDPADGDERILAPAGNLPTDAGGTGARSTRQPQPWSKPRPSLPPKPADAVAIAEIPDRLLTTPTPVRELTKVGEVLGQEIYAPTSIVEKAAQLRANLGKPDGYWPSDALTATVLALRMGLHPKPTYREIATMLNLSERQVLRCARRGKKTTTVEREIARLDAEGMPMAVENVLDGLEGGDKEYTLEYLKGRGVFRQKHETVVDPNAAATAFPGLIVQFIHDGSAPAEIKAGSIVAAPNRALHPGAPALLDVEKSPS